MKKKKQKKKTTHPLLAPPQNQKITIIFLPLPPLFFSLSNNISTIWKGEEKKNDQKINICVLRVDQ